MWKIAKWLQFNNANSKSDKWGDWGGGGRE